MSVITLLTDFGSTGWYPSQMKGVIKNINPDLDIIDISHNITPFDIDETIMVLASSYKHFPHKTIHLIVVDPGVGSLRKGLLVETDTYFFIAPDNGVLEWIFKHENILEVVELSNESYFNKPVSNTFHGRDIFAPVGAHLSTGISVEKFGEFYHNYYRREKFYPLSIDANTVVGTIIATDSFGNLITNIHISFFSTNDINNICVRTSLKEQGLIQMGRCYSDSDANEIMTLFGSSGFLEISARESSAFEKTMLSKGDTIEVSINDAV